MAVRGKRGAAGGKKAKGAKAGKAKKVAEAPKEESEAEEEEVSEEAKDADENQDKVEETAITVAKDVPAEGSKGKKHKTKAHRIEEAVKRAEAEDGAAAEGEQSVKGVLYLGHIPFGFGEPQMRKYFNQFGTVLRLRLSRSKSNAASKGYAFIEFEEREVAKIVAQTMDGYMMFSKKLVCHVMDPEKVHPRLFKGWNRIMQNQTRLRNVQARRNYNDRPQVEVDGERVSRTTCQQLQRRQKSNKKLQALLETLEVDYDLSAFSLPDSPKVKAALSPKLKAGTPPPQPGKRKRDAAEAEAAANELVAEDKETEALSKQSSPANSEKKARHRRRRGPPPVIQEAAKATEKAAPKKKAAKKK